MPTFFPQHTPANLDEFTRGYLECAEWLASGQEEPGEMSDDERFDCQGFHPDSITQAVADCIDFQEANAADLEAYEEATGRGMSSAGHDFYLTRNRHGAGFWDRGNDACLKRLTDAAHAYGESDCMYEDGFLYLS